MESGQGESLPQGTRARILRHPLSVWGGFLLAHLWVGWLALTGPGMPLGDLDTYAFWLRYGLEEGVWVGIDTLWVYPIGALVPMLAAGIAGFDAYRSMWVSLVLVADMIALAVLLGVRARPAHVAWWWSAFLVLLGPIAVGRIDAFAVAIALCAMALLVARPALAGALLAIATWIKVWPAALIAAAVIALRQRLAILVGAAALSVAVLLVMVALGGASTVFSFLGTQQSRGLQIEAVLATPLMWMAAAGDSAAGAVVYDSEILTFQLSGPAAALLAAMATPLLVVLAVVLLVLAILATARGADPARLLPPLVLALTVALIVGNKVGSPQFASWLAVPVLYGLVQASRGGMSFRVPAIITLVIALLTQLVYPTFYGELIRLSPAVLTLLSLRNLLSVVLLGWAIVRLGGVVAHARSEPRHGAAIGT